MLSHPHWFGTFIFFSCLLSGTTQGFLLDVKHAGKYAELLSLLSLLVLVLMTDMMNIKFPVVSFLSEIKSEMLLAGIFVYDIHLLPPFLPDDGVLLGVFGKNSSLGREKCLPLYLFGLRFLFPRVPGERM